ncbi:hypothetical protein CC78DRAFT_536068 [Lojkania enalia]|uniref:Chalcone isomerase domain-containing protein n=1 Tax=Lojkania enalia TaxID=147567 RepID=A0A9P4N015_9PLEO|nr:hypothetical protein CC78DRAFT_536068 [Didymosphaeria enalia]
MRVARHRRRQKWLLLGAVLSMVAPMFLVRLWDLPEDKKDKEKDAATKAAEKQEARRLIMEDAARRAAEDAAKKPGERKSRGILDLITPTKTDSPKVTADSFQGKKVIVAAGDRIIAAPEGAEHPSVTDEGAIELVSTGTSYVPYFPRTIHLPTSTSPEVTKSDTEYTLLGLGIRTVSFLRVQVYVVGLYVKTADLSTFQNHLINTVNPSASALIPGEKEDLRKALLDPEKSSQIWESILSNHEKGAVSMAFRVVPTRGTDFKHLQDGWMRGIASRTDEVRRKQAELLRQQASEEKRIALPKPVEENEFSDESFGLAMKEFKDLFQGRGKAPKGSIVLMTRDKDGVLGLYHQPITKTNKGEKQGEMVCLGEVRDPRVGKLVWQLYLGGKNVSSESARRDVVDGCMQLVERPVGTVEGMVQ